MPVHGEYKHLKSHADLAKQLGMSENKIFIPETGHALEISSKKAQYGGTVPWGQVYVDGYGVGDVGSSVLKERKHLAEDGMFVVVFAADLQERILLSDIEIISKGFVYIREQESLIEDVRALAKKTVLECFGHGNRDANSIKNKVKDAVASKLYSKTKKKPMVLPVLTDISL